MCVNPHGHRLLTLWGWANLLCSARFALVAALGVDELVCG